MTIGGVDQRDTPPASREPRSHRQRVRDQNPYIIELLLPFTACETVANDVRVSPLSQGGLGGIAFRIKRFQRCQIPPNSPKYPHVPPWR